MSEHSTKDQAGNWKKVFGIIWTGQLFSTLSSGVVGYAVVFWLSMETRSAEVLAFTTIAHMLPQLVMGPLTGVFIDRWDRRRVMILADVFIALCSAFMALLFYLDKVELGHIYLLLALRSAGSAFHMPAMQASVPLLAPESELMRVAGVNQVIQSVSSIAGPALAALLISYFSMTNVLLFDVLGATMACISLVMVTIPNPARQPDAHPPDIVREMKEGILAVVENRGMLWLFIFAILANFLIMPVAALFPLMTVNHFAGGTYQMSLVEVSWGAGMLLGGALLGILKMKTDRITLINSMYWLLGLTFALSGLLPANRFAYFVALTLLGGVSGAIYFGSFNVVLQTNIEPVVLGRVFSLFGSITLLPSMIGLLQTGFIADSIGVTNTFIISGTGIFLIGIISFLVPALRRMSKEL